MKKSLSVLILVGILSSAFLGYGAKKGATIISEENINSIGNDEKAILNDEKFSRNLEKLVEEDDVNKNDTKVLKEPTRIEIVVSKSLDSDEGINIRDYNLNPDEAINLFYKNNPDGLITQKKVYNFLIDKYKDASLESFNEHRLEVEENIKGVTEYVSKPKSDIEPFVFIGKTPIYVFKGWLGAETTVYINYRGNSEAFDSIKLAFENGYLYRIKNGQIVKVISMPNINDDDSISLD